MDIFNKQKVKDLEIEIAKLNYQIENKPAFEVGKNYKYGKLISFKFITKNECLGYNYVMTYFGYEYKFESTGALHTINDIVSELDNTIIETKPKMLFNYTQPEPPKVFKVSDVEKLQYELNFPRKYNIGDVYKKVYKCVNVVVNTRTDIEDINLHFGMVSREQITGRTYIFKKDNERLEIFEAVKK